MADRDDYRRMALSWMGHQRRPISDRRAVLMARIVATLAPDGATVNVKLGPAEQAFQMRSGSRDLSPDPDAWGRQGWTRKVLASIDPAELNSPLHDAWAGSQKKSKRRR